LLVISLYCCGRTAARAAQAYLEVSGLLRVLQVGEGLSYREDEKPDFAAEVAAMAAGGK